MGLGVHVQVLWESTGRSGLQRVPDSEDMEPSVLGPCRPGMGARTPTTPGPADFPQPCGAQRTCAAMCSFLSGASGSFSAEQSAAHLLGLWFKLRRES